MINVAIYCRLSDEDRNKFRQSDDSESIQNQKSMLTQYAINNGWQIYKTYSDDDYSGLDKDRPSWNEMIKEAEERKFQIILCKSQSRFTRDLELVEKYLHNKFIEWGIRFIGLVDNADTFNKGNKKQRQIIGLTNEWYCEEISENIRAVFDMKRSKGEFIGSFATYGYEKDPLNKNRLIVDEQAAEIVKMIFRMYLGGYGTQHIAFILNEKNIPNPTKYKQNKGLNFKNAGEKNDLGLWNKTTIKRILKNEVYIGNMIQGKRKKISYKSKLIKGTDMSKWFKVEQTHQLIIDKASFYEVQRRIENNQRSTGDGPAHIFATKVKCADCGNTMLKVTNTNGSKRYAYLRCRLYSATSNTCICTSHSINLDDLQDSVALKLKENFKKYVDDDWVSANLKLEEDINRRLRILNADLESVNKQLQNNAHVLKNLYLDRVKGIVSEDSFIELHKNFSNEKEALQKRKVDIDRLADETNAKFKYVYNWEEIINKYKDFDELTREMVNLFVSSIEIAEKNKKTGEQKVKINWMF